MSHRLPILACLTLATLATVAGCESSTIIEGRISFGAQIMPPAHGDLLVVVEGFAEPATWSPIGEAGDPSEAEPYLAGQADFTYRWEEFGTVSPHALYVAAFLDLDGDGTLGSGEPFGVFTANPLIDAPAGVTASASTADIVIDTVAP